MPRSPLVAARALRQALGGFEPEAFSGEDCARLAEELARTENACAAARVRAATRAADVGAHARRGYADPVDWVARTSGTTAGQAKTMLSAAAALQDCPATNDAVASGELSLAQGAEIAKTEAACPGSEAQLLGLARSTGLGVLRDKARSRRLRSMNPEELHARQHGAREFRHWRDDMGMVRLVAALPPQAGIPIVSRLEAETDRIRKRARREHSDEPRAAHAADAFVMLMAGQGNGKRDRADLVVVWDRSGVGDDDEGTAHIVGGGPIPVAEARRLAERAFVKALIRDGVRIQAIKHVGRSIPAELRTALELGDPPGFDGLTCVDCGSRHGVQRDHVDPVANGGLTSYDNLAGRCWECHEKKTEADRQAGLLGGTDTANGSGSGGEREPP